MKTKKTVLCYIIIASLIASLPIKSGLGATGSYYPTDTNDDGFITQIGNHFADTPYLPLRSATTDVIDGLRFRNLSIPQDAKINNATLFVRTLHTYDPGLVLVTIYGVDENDAYAFNSSGDFTRAYTTNHVVWNVSEVNGYAWHNVSVTAIVQEIISRYGWRTGNDLAFIILADSGEPRREFASIDNNIAWRPRLDITYDVTPPDPSTGANPPYNDTDQWTWTLNDTYRGFDIWDVIYTFANRTGIGADVNWNTINMSLLSEHDNGGAITLNNDTWVNADNFRKAYIGSIYNDTGSANINSYFLRWKINVTEVTTSEVGNDLMPFVFALSTASPTTTDGMAYGTSGQWAGIIGQVHSDKEQWRVLIRERSGAASAASGVTGWFSETTPRMLYFEGFINMTGIPYIIFSTYNDSSYTELVTTITYVFTIATGPFQYPQILAGDAQATTGSVWYDCYTYLDFDLTGFDPVQFITYPNGTLVDPDPIDDPKDIIDDILGGADPEDPETDKYGTALTKNRWKTFVFVIGMVMFLGTPTFAMMARVSIGRWIMVLFISLCGLSILWSIIYM